MCDSDGDSRQAYANIIETHRIFQTSLCRKCDVYYTILDKEEEEGLNTHNVCHKCREMVLFNTEIRI